MSAPILPAGLEFLADYLTQLEDRVGLLEAPQGPVPAWPCTSAALPVPAGYVTAMVLVTDLSVLAYSDGTDWIRTDTGAPI